MKRELTYLIQFKILTLTRKSQLSECIAIMFSTSTETSYSNGSYFRCKKTIPSGTFAGRQLLSIVEGIVELNQFKIDDQVTKTNKLKGITEMIINLDELNNSVNLKDGRPSHELLTYHVTSNEDFICLEPQNPQYKKLKNGEFTSLTLRITDQNNNVITDGPQVTVVLHIHDRKI